MLQYPAVTQKETRVVPSLLIAILETDAEAWREQYVFPNQRITDIKRSAVLAERYQRVSHKVLWEL